MSFLHQTLLQFLEEVDSKSATPGGGSVSALSALLGISLARMVCHVTIGRKAFKALSEEQQQELHTAFEELAWLKEAVLPLVDEDTKAFNAIMEAYRLPKESDQEQHIRNQAIEQATIGAIDVPLHVASLSLQAVQQLPPIVTFGNKNAISDVGVALLELSTAAQGALMNVEINLSGLSDVKQKAHYTETSDQLKQALFENIQNVHHLIQQRN